LGKNLGDSSACRKAFWLWVVFLLVVKGMVSTYPYAQDDRAVWRALKPQCPSGKGTVVLIDGGLNGIGFYSDLPVRNVQWGSAYLYFDPPPKLADLVAQLRQSEDWVVFVTDAYRADLGGLLGPYGVVGAPMPLPGRHAAVLLRFSRPQP
jgi:hypothetical protein